MQCMRNCGIAFSRSFSRGRAPFGQRFLVLTKRSAASGDENGLLGNSPFSREPLLKAETHDGTNRGDTSPRLHCWSDKSLALSLSLRINQYKPVWICATDGSDEILSQRQKFSHVTRGDLLQQPVEATCRSDLSHRVSRLLEFHEMWHENTSGNK